MAAELITNATQNVTGIYEMFQYIHNDVSSLFFPLILFGIYVVTFIILKSNSYSNSRPFAGTCFFGMVLAVILRALGFLSNTYTYLSVSLVGIAVVWLHLDKDYI